MKEKPNYMLIISIAFMAFNLRPAITAVGPLLGLIRQDLAISNTVAGLITTIPLLFFSAGAFVASPIGRRFGIEPTLLAALFVVGAGILIRSYGGTAGFFLGTAMIGTGIAMGNVLMPALIKLRFPLAIGAMTGFYTFTLTLMSSISVGSSLFLATWRGSWRHGLACWVVLTLAGIVAWLPQVREKTAPANRQAADRTGSGKKQERSVYTSALAWYITIFNGLQSMVFYCFVAWLPMIVQERTVYSGAPGTLSLLYMLVSLLGNVLAPILCDRMRDQRPVALGLCSFYLVGLALFFFSQSQMLLIVGVVFCGIGMGASFSYALVLVALRTANSRQAAALSGMSLAVGYLIAAVGPTLIGAIYDKTLSWTWPILFLGLAMVGMLYFGVKSGKEGRLFHSVWFSQQEESKIER